MYLNLVVKNVNNLLTFDKDFMDFGGISGVYGPCDSLPLPCYEGKNT